MPRKPQHTSRRGFLQAGTLLSLSTLTYRGAFAADTPPSERVRVGFIGVGGQGKGNLKALLKNAVAVCDVDSKRLAEAASIVEKANGAAPFQAVDYRTLLDRKDIDAVLITTPDHWHALQTVNACQAGKDVYCEKPLTLTIAEGRAMVNAARKHNRVVQTGSQQRSAKEFRTACEMVRGGAIGKVKNVLVGLPGVNFKPPGVPDSAPPAELNYDLWLGPAPQRPYNEKRVHYLFRFFWDYSGGQQTNFGAHHLDIAQWGLDMDNSGPVSAEAKARFNKEGWYEVPEWTEINYRYASGVTMVCGQGQPGGTTFEGDKGVIHVNRGKLEVRINGEKLAPAKYPKVDVKLYASDNHHKNWLDCIKSRAKPICDVEIGHRSATVCHLGNIAVRTGQAIAWDPEKEQIINNPEAAKMVEKAYRAPWKLG